MYEHQDYPGGQLSVFGGAVTAHCVTFAVAYTPLRGPTKELAGPAVELVENGTVELLPRLLAKSPVLWRLVLIVHAGMNVLESWGG
jgi:hypothetical protein